MKKFRSIVAALLAVLMLFSLAACGAGDDSSADGQDSGDAVYNIGVNAWGTAPVLAAYADEEEYAVAALGMTSDRASDDNNADKELQNIQNFIAQGVDGLCIAGAGATTIPQMAEEAKNAEVPFALCIFTGSEDIRAELSANNEFYAGASAADLQADGRTLAERALAEGCQTACIIGGNIGDLNMDNRAKGFTDAFVAGGGVIVAEERCADNSECLAKASSMLSANKDVDCVYIMVGDYVEGTLSAIDTLGIEGIKCYLSAVNAGSADYIRQGIISAATGGATLACYVAPALIMNMLDGHTIKDADGNAPFFGVSPSLVTAETIDAYVELFCTEGVHPISAEVIQSLCYRYNPDVTYESMLEVIETQFTVDAIIAANAG